MPVVSVPAKNLWETLRSVNPSRVGATYEPDSFYALLEDLAFEFGLELDGWDDTAPVKSADVGKAPDAAKQSDSKQDGDMPSHAATSEAKASNAMVGEARSHDANDIFMKLRVEVGANRYDLLCLEGISHALAAFLHPTPPSVFPIYKYSVHEPSITMTVSASVQKVRPFAIAAAFRNVEMSDEVLGAFIELQEKLHFNLGRRRTLVAIGAHDMDSIGPGTTYTYDCMTQEDNFRPLNFDKEVSKSEFFAALAESSVKSYLPILQTQADAESAIIPTIRDPLGRILSVPPIINCDFSRLKRSSRNLFIEITATDQNKASIVLDSITIFLTAHNALIEPVRIVYHPQHQGIPEHYVHQHLPCVDGQLHAKKFLREIVTPRLNHLRFDVSLQYLQHTTGILTLKAEQVVELLPKMILKVTEQYVRDGDTILTVEAPIHRRDILHPCDIAEDLAVAYGYMKLSRIRHPAVTVLPISAVSERIRRLLSQCGWREALTFGLISLRDCLDNLRRKSGPARVAEYASTYEPVKVADPRTREFECLRPTLIGGLLKNLSANRSVELPIKLFEIGDVVFQDRSENNLSCQRRNVAALFADANKSGLEDVHGLLEAFLSLLGVRPAYLEETDTGSAPTFSLEECEDGPFLPSRSVQVVLRHKGSATRIGVMGVIHPEVLQSFAVPFPASLWEISLEHLMRNANRATFMAP